MICGFAHAGGVRHVCACHPRPSVPSESAALVHEEAGEIISRVCYLTIVDARQLIALCGVYRMGTILREPL